MDEPPGADGSTGVQRVECSLVMLTVSLSQIVHGRRT